LLPQDLLVRTAIIPDPNGFKLGVASYLDDPLRLVEVTKGSLAEKIRLKVWERILEFDGKSPKDATDLKSMIKAAAGRKVKIKSLDVGINKTREWEATVPADLAAP
jgi:membrane-associated protease RseP (regulator of RpoE activity)